MKQEINSRLVNWSGRGHDYTDEEIRALADVMHIADPLTQGRYQQEFEESFCKYVGVKHAFAVANCTNALDLAAVLCRIGPEDEVVIPAHTFCASAIPFARTGAKIVWADIDNDTRLISADTIKKVLTSRTKVVVVVHLYGLMASMPSIMELANTHRFIVVEDCAQAIGAEINGRKAGTFGDFACFSFHGAKNMSTLGEGGMLVVRGDDLASLVPGLRHNGVRPYSGERPHYWKPAMSDVDADIAGVWPYNFCLGEIQCALGTRLLSRIDKMNEARIQRAKKFIHALSDFTELSFQYAPKGHKHIYHLLSARLDRSAQNSLRDRFIDLMWNNFSVKVIVQYHPLYRYPLFQKNGFGKADCPNTDHFFDNMVSFPFHHWMKEADFDYMIDATKATLVALRAS